jgi:AraC-like DNA-binding protein
MAFNDKQMAVKAKMSIIKDIIYEASVYGANIDLLCQKVGLAKADLDEGERWVELEQAAAVWEQAVLLTGKQNLGLLIGQNGNPYVIGIVGYLIESSPDVYTALDNICRFNEIYADMFRYSYEIKGEQYYIYFTPAQEWWDYSPETARQAIETSMARTLSIIKKFTGKNVLPLKALFNYPCPTEESIYSSSLKTALQFNAGMNALVFDLTAMQLPVASHNQTLYKQFEALALAKLETLEANKGLSTQIKQQLFIDFDQQLPSIEQIAERMGLSVRTMQRKLKTEGHTFQEITDEVRKDMALGFIQKENNSINQIAAFLGYSDPSVFRRAFKRWTGMTPREYIQSN